MNVRVPGFAGYELLDSGAGRKLERFGDVILDRPSPQAIWPKQDAKRWSRAAASFSRGKQGNGDWRIHRESLPEAWEVWTTAGSVPLPRGWPGFLRGMSWWPAR